MTVDENELLSQHIEALFVHDTEHRLVHTNDITRRPAPRFYLGRTRHCVTWRFRDDLDDDLMNRLQTLCRNEPIVDDLRLTPLHDGTYRSLLEPVHSIWSGPALYFPRAPRPQAHDPQAVAITPNNIDLLRGTFDDWIGDVPSSQPFLAIIEDRRAVAVCASVRVKRSAHEAGVETLASHRGRGLAPRVVDAWSRAVEELGARPLYSTSWSNLASQRVAEKLELAQYASDYHIT